MSNTTVQAVSPALPKSDEEIMTAEQWAAFDFEPWTHTEDEWKPPVDKEWMDDGRSVLPFVRMAWIALHRTKAELVEGFGKLDDDDGTFETMMDGIAHAQEFFENFATILKAGEARLMCAASAALRAGNEEAA
jgi:hypothetical protein